MTITTTHDVYQFINDADDATIERIIERLEFRGQDPTFTMLRDSYFDRLPLENAESILVLGCGPGVNVRALATRPEVSGRIVGLDHSPRLIEAARRAAADLDTDAPTEFDVGDAHELPYGDAEFSLTIIHTVLSHVQDPLRVLREASRVTEPGGTLAIFDGDYASWTWATDDPAFGQAVDDAFRVGVISHPRVMCDLPRLAGTVGLRIIDAEPYLYADVGMGKFFLEAAEIYGPYLAKIGLLTAAQVEAWLAEQRRAASEGTFFAACAYYTFLVQRPLR